ncbi:hypothetical protein DFQ28_008307 [Apophysomyces sp. BC1034]|nr:hypothetical protein DFQ29_006582 [Apophysomyces sp. BC1021]KAG0192684.1 hypothetical protein DFQ28_008307 [Apophysomyces sp. BC1034]
MLKFKEHFEETIIQKCISVGERKARLIGQTNAVQLAVIAAENYYKELTTKCDGDTAKKPHVTVQIIPKQIIPLALAKENVTDFIPRTIFMKRQQ